MALFSLNNKVQNASTRGLRRLAVQGANFAVLAQLAWVTLGCGATAQDPTDTNTNWLAACEDDSDCGSSLRCLCNACTVECDDDEQCSAQTWLSCAPVAAQCGQSLSTCQRQALVVDVASPEDGGSDVLTTVVEDGNADESTTGAPTADSSTAPCDACSSALYVCEGDFSVSSPDELEALTACTEITGSLYISDLVDLEPLANLRRVGETLGIGDWYAAAPLEVNLAGLRSLEVVGSLSLVNLQVPDLAGFSNLKRVGTPEDDYDSLETYQVSAQSLHGLESLEGARRLWLNEMPNLTSLDGLDSLRELDTLELDNLPALTTTATLPVTALGSLSITACDQLEVLEFHEPLVELGAFSAYTNAGLREIHVLDALEYLKVLHVNDNPKLASLHLPNLYQSTYQFEVLRNATLATLDVPRLTRAVQLVVANNPQLPNADVVAWANALTVIEVTKVGANLGDEVEPRDPCPWLSDMCDEIEGTNLCAAGTDPGCRLEAL